MELGIGNTLATSGRVWLRNLTSFTVLSLVIHLPLAIWLVLSLRGELTEARLDALDAYLGYGGFFAGVVLNILVTSTLVYGVVMELRGARASIGASVWLGLKRFLPSLGVTLLMSLLVGLGVLTWFIPGAMVYCIFYVAVPASVLERPGVGGALLRSSQLVNGHGFRIFGLAAIILGGSFGLSYLVKQALFDPNASLDALRIYVAVDLVREVLTSTFAAVVVSVTYARLRELKDGTTADQLAEVFD